ncbi:DUF2147 domain-containing protein [Spirosoma linguale]|uniref:DUF2147 domain-containing protein n=1 Tax=Spirosoma linguale (strain ATCC 33905 / DSM 74 / LMG 10896 / Claus 1) TaxID=504472 RepID=D2QTM8_SPILD|nr:Protein of unknown function DUF2147 [Spirosoma linguale DSM 74]
MNPLRLIALFLLVCLSLSSFANASDDPDALVGRWLSSKKRNQVQIYKQGNKYFGKLVWMLEPNEPGTSKLKVDKANPDEKLRNRPLMQMVLLTNLTYKGNNVWSDGEIYNPEDGKTYNCEVTLKDPNSIDLRGYVMGLSFLGKSKTWTRVK